MSSACVAPVTDTLSLPAVFNTAVAGYVVPDIKPTLSLCLALTFGLELCQVREIMNLESDIGYFLDTAQQNDAIDRFALTFGIRIHIHHAWENADESGVDWGLYSVHPPPNPEAETRKPPVLHIAWYNRNNFRVVPSLQMG